MIDVIYLFLGLTMLLWLTASYLIATLCYNCFVGDYPDPLIGVNKALVPFYFSFHIIWWFGYLPILLALMISNRSSDK